MTVRASLPRILLVCLCWAAPSNAQPAAVPPAPPAGDVGEAARAIESIATTAALGLGGVWTWMLFVRRRQRFPRASVTHEIHQRRLDSGDWLLHIAVTIENKGEVLLRPVGYLLRVQQMLPVHPRLQSAVQVAVPLPENATEYLWPALAERRRAWEVGEFEIEPGELDRIYCDVVVPGSMRTIEVYSHLKNQSKGKRRIGWTITSLHDL